MEEARGDNAGEAVPGNGRRRRVRKAAGSPIAQGQGEETHPANGEKANRQEKKAKTPMSKNNDDAKEKAMNFVQELALTMPVPDLARDLDEELGERTPIADAFAEWLEAVSLWQDEVEQRLARLEGKMDALCQIVSH